MVPCCINGYSDNGDAGLCREEEAEKVADEVLSLSVHPSLSKADVNKTTKVVKGVTRSER